MSRPTEKSDFMRFGSTVACPNGNVKQLSGCSFGTCSSQTQRPSPNRDIACCAAGTVLTASKVGRALHISICLYAVGSCFKACKGLTTGAFRHGPRLHGGSQHPESVTWSLTHACHASTELLVFIHVTAIRGSFKKWLGLRYLQQRVVCLRTAATPNSSFPNEACSCHDQYEAVMCNHGLAEASIGHRAQRPAGSPVP